MKNCVFMSMALSAVALELLSIHRRPTGGVCAGERRYLFSSPSLLFILHFVCDCYYEAINFNKRRKSREANRK